MQLLQSRMKYEQCPLCDTNDFKVLKTADCSKHPLYHPAILPAMTWCQCRSCDHVFTEGYFTDEAARLIFSRTNDRQKVGFDLENQRNISADMIEKVLDFVTDGCWLDIGFGNGSLLLTAEEYGFIPVGLDLREKEVNALRSMGIEAHSVDILEFDRPDRFSVISMADVLEHMPFPKKALHSVHRLLKSNGIILLSMPNSESPVWRSLDANQANPYWGEIEHYHNFNRTILYRTLRESGFEPIRYGISRRYRACMEVIARKVRRNE